MLGQRRLGEIGRYSSAPTTPPDWTVSPAASERFIILADIGSALETLIRADEVHLPWR